MENFLKLGPTDGFVALTSIENNDPKVIAGFHFGQSEQATRQFIEPRLAKWLPAADGAKRETIPYAEQVDLAEMPSTAFECNPAYVHELRVAIARR